MCEPKAPRVMHLAAADRSTTACCDRRISELSERDWVTAGKYEITCPLYSNGQGGAE